MEKKTLMEKAISIARWELSNLTKSGAPQTRQRAASHMPHPGPISDGVFQSYLYHDFLLFRFLSLEEYHAERFIARRAIAKNVFSS
jgi:hypothetical protein